MGHGVVTHFGGSGFLGRHIVGWLAGQGAGVRAASRYPERTDVPGTGVAGGEIEPVCADVRDRLMAMSGRFDGRKGSALRC
jgi:NADH dehydrogenase